MPSHLSARCGVALLSASFLCGQAVAQGKAPEPLPTAQLQALAQVYDMLRKNMAEPVEGDKMVIGAIRGLVRAADPDGDYFTEEERKYFEYGPSGGPAGIGVELTRRDASTVVTPLAGNAAETMGLKAGDLLLAIDGKAVYDMDLQAAASALRGEVGSKVRLRIRRGLEVQPIELEIERQIVVRRNLNLTRADAGVLVLAVHAMNDGLLEELAKRLGEEWARQPWRGLVLDLRANAGGAVHNAIGLAALFLPHRAEIARMHGSLPQANFTFRATPADYRSRSGDPFRALPAALRERPMVVLVDAYTAAGAEIVTAALKDHQRAPVIGHKTFGRGSIQSMMRLSNGQGAVKITTAYWESPSGARIHKVGVLPDEPLAAGQDPAQDLAAAVAALKKRLPS